MNENEIEIYDYLMLPHGQEEDVVELLSEDSQAHGRYKHSDNLIALTWLTSFHQLEKLDPPSKPTKYTVIISSTATGVENGYS